MYLAISSGCVIWYSLISLHTAHVLNIRICACFLFVILSICTHSCILIQLTGRWHKIAKMRCIILCACFVSTFLVFKFDILNFCSPYKMSSQFSYWIQESLNKNYCHCSIWLLKVCSLVMYASKNGKNIERKKTLALRT